jgi:hypothetical protein
MSIVDQAKEKRAKAVAGSAKLDAEMRKATNASAKRYAAELAAKVLPPLVLDAAALLRTELKPVRAVVPRWIYEGLGLIAAAPKVGKSTLTLQIAVAKASGGEFWGSQVPKGKVLMIDLETNERRLRRKLDEAGVTSIEPGMLLYATAWPRGPAGVAAIAEYVDQHGVQLVIVDTWQRFREVQDGRKNAYSADYESLAAVQELCKSRPGLAILAVHHRRKASTDDPIESINGSAGLAASADAIWIITRKGGDFFLHIEARDWERDDNEFRIERDSGQWALSNAPRHSQAEGEVLRLLDIGKGMTPSALAEALGVSRQAVHVRLKRMLDADLVRVEQGVWHAAV